MWLVNSTNVENIEKRLNNIIKYLCYHDRFLSLVEKLKKTRNDDKTQYHHNLLAQTIDVVELNGHTAPDGTLYNKWTGVYSYDDFEKYVENELLRIELNQCKKRCKSKENKK